MQSFRTILPPLKNKWTIQPSHHLLCLGSCFANHIGERLLDHRFRTVINPFGILYHPVAITNALEWLLRKGLFSEKDLFEYQGQWHSFQHHGQFSHPDVITALKQINASLENGRTQLAQADWLVLTLGTANGFFHQKTQAFVANCHKLPGQEFIRKTISTEVMVDKLEQTLGQLQQSYPQLKIILTVSPVRHIRDGFVENQRSKARLIIAAEALEKTVDQLHYFPAYELLMDDLRDYRFYKNDLIHPSEMAIDYVWEYFSNAYFSEDTQDYARQIARIQKALTHRPIRPESETHLKFKEKLIVDMTLLEKKYKHLNFGEERNELLA